MLDQLLFKLIRLFTPMTGKGKIKPANQINWNVIRHTTQRPGYHIVSHPKIIKTLQYLIRKLPHEVYEPTINPLDISTDLYIKYFHQLPEESTYTTLVEFYLYSTGSYYLRPSDLPQYTYMVDFTDLEQYPVRDEFYAYGGKWYFHQHKLVYAIQYGQPLEFPLAEYILRASTSLKLTVDMHAIRIHICSSQPQAIEYRKISKHNKITDILNILTLDAFEVNSRIPILIEPYGLAHRLYAFTDQGYINYLNDALSQPPLTGKEIYGYPETPWNIEITKYANGVRELLINLDTPHDMLENLVEYMVICTAMHNQFGDKEVYSTVIDGLFIPKIYKNGPGLLSKLDVDLLCTLLVAVSPRYPKIGDPEVLNGFRDSNDKQAWIDWVFKTLSTHNERWFSPQFFETSVGF